MKLAVVRSRLLLLVISFVFGLTACGGDGSSSPSSAPIATGISAQPSSVSAVGGTAATFSVVATGDGLAYQWQRSTDAGVTFAAIAGATSSTYSIATVDATLNGFQYRVVVTGAAGVVISSAVTLTVAAALVAPTISAQPVAQSVVAGGTASFSVTSAGTSITYQWQSSSDGVTFANLTGATNATLTLTGLTTGDSGRRLRVVITNSVGSVTSTAVVLTVAPAPVAPVITAHPLSVSVVTPATATFTVVASAVPIASYQWQVSTDGGTTFVDIASATSASYTTPATVPSDSGKLFRVRVTNSVGTAVSFAAALTVGLATAPTITIQPASQRVTAPAAATFFVTASGSPTPTYQWQLSVDSGVTFNNVNGATSSTFTIASTTSTDNGKQFRAIISNALGSVTSNAVTLAIQNGTGTLGGNPIHLSFDSEGNLDVDIGISIRQVKSSNTITTLTSSIGGPIASIGNGSIAVGDSQSTALSELIRVISSTGVVTTLAGGIQGYRDGNSSDARFKGISGIAVDAVGNLIVAESANRVVRKVTPTGVTSTLAGVTPDIVANPLYRDGPAATALFASVDSVAIDAAGNIYIVDGGNNAIRKLDTAGIVSTIAGGTYGFADGTGAAARFSNPKGIVIDPAGNLYVADYSNSAIRKVSPLGVVTTVAGNGVAGFADGVGSFARFSFPYGITIDSAGNLFIADYVNGAIRKVTPSGAVTTLATN